MEATPEVGTVESTALTAVKSTAIVETSSTAVAARAKAAVEARFLYAMHHPRNPDNARQQILKVCRRLRFAESARYSKPIGRNKVHGLSVRFSEEVSRLWGNIFVQANVVFDDRERRIYNVIATDLETNTATEQDVVVEKFVERRNVKDGDDVIGSRKNKSGDTVYLKAATEDEILIKANAALSKIRRNLTLTLIPADIREEAEEAAMETVKNQDTEDPDGARKRLLDSFFEQGVSADRVQGWLGKPLETLVPAELALLRAAYTALKDGEATLAEIEADSAFQHDQPGKEDPKGKGTSALKERVKKKTVKKKTAKKNGNDKPQAANEEANESKAKALSEEEQEAEAVRTVEEEEDARIRAEEAEATQ